MDGIVSLLDPQHHSLVETIWRELDEECGLNGIAITPIPHFSWHVAADYDPARLKDVLAGIAAQIAPFSVRTSGLGIFSGHNPVIYIPVVKDQALQDLHRRILDAVLPIALIPHPYYTPQAWMPHITLAYGDVLPDRLICAIEKLGARRFDWEIEIDCLAHISQAEGEVGQERLNFRLAGPPK
jgi:2'-5' RNA ligase